MSNFTEIDQALRILTSKSLKKNKIIVLHCNTAYPTPYKDVNLKVLDEFKKRYKNRFGLSDHSLGIEVPIAAAALDAKVIEKHFTLNKKFKGPDHKSSLEPKEFSKMVNSIRNIDLAKGSNFKKVTMSEKKNIFFARKSIVAKIPIKKGQKFTDKNITVKRPGNGLSPMLWPKVIKKKSKGKFLEKMNKLGKSIKKILIVSGGRADYDLLKPVILKLKKVKSLNIKIGITGSHLFKQNKTYKNFIRDNLNINYKVKIPFSK